MHPPFKMPPVVVPKGGSTLALLHSLPAVPRRPGRKIILENTVMSSAKTREYQSSHQSGLI